MPTPTKIPLSIPVPRLVTGTVRRCQAPEKVLLLEGVPMLVPSVAEADAPLALRVGGRGVHRYRSTTHRTFDGACWAPFDHGGELDGIRPERLEAVTRDRLSYVLGARHATDDNQRRQEFADWRTYAEGFNRKRGLPSPDDVAFASVDDDGRAAQAAVARRAQGNLLLVDGRLHHRAPTPCLTVDLSVPMRCARVSLSRPDWPLPGEPDPTLGWASFPLGRRDRAEAFAHAWARREAARAGAPFDVTFDEPDVVEVGTLPPEPSAALRAESMASGFMEALRPAVGELDDRSLMGFMELRRALRAGVRDEAAGLCVMGMVASISGSLAAGRGPGEPPPEAFAAAAESAAMALLRVETDDGPGLAEEDGLAMMGIAP